MSTLGKFLEHLLSFKALKVGMRVDLPGNTKGQSFYFISQGSPEQTLEKQVGKFLEEPVTPHRERMPREMRDTEFPSQLLPQRTGWSGRSCLETHPAAEEL